MVNLLDVKNADGQNEFDTKKIFQLQLNHPGRIFSPIYED